MENSYKGNTNLSFIFDRGRNTFEFISEQVKDLMDAREVLINPEWILQQTLAEDFKYLEQAYDTFFKGSYSGSTELRLKINDNIRWLRVTPFILPGHPEHLVAGHVEDITAEIGYVDFIRKYANKKNSILHMLAHDLRGPLNIAKELTRQVHQKITAPGMQEMSDTVQTLISQSISLIKDLTDREFIDAVGIELYQKRINIVSKIAEYLEECKIGAGVAERTFNFSFSASEIMAELDEAKLMQVLNNLMSNALKFTHPGGTITLELSEENDWVKIIFKDDGIGIPEDQLPVIFDRFTKAGRPGLNNEPSVGLGLSIVQTIIFWHNGTISVKSIENEGTTFTIMLPLSRMKIKHSRLEV